MKNASINISVRPTQEEQNLGSFCVCVCVPVRTCSAQAQANVSVPGNDTKIISAFVLMLASSMFSPVLKLHLPSLVLLALLVRTRLNSKDFTCTNMCIYTA